MAAHLTKEEYIRKHQNEISLGPFFYGLSRANTHRILFVCMFACILGLLSAIFMLSMGHRAFIFYNPYLQLLESKFANAMPAMIVICGVIGLYTFSVGVISCWTMTFVNFAWQYTFKIKLNFIIFKVFLVVTGVFVFSSMMLVAACVSEVRQMTDGFKKALKMYRIDPDVRIIFDRMQSNLECCGNTNFKDWFYSPWYPNHFKSPTSARLQSILNTTKVLYMQDTPYSCCDMNQLRPCIHKNIFKNYFHASYNFETSFSIHKIGCDLVFKNRYLRFIQTSVTIPFAIALAAVLICLPLCIVVSYSKNFVMTEDEFWDAKRDKMKASAVKYDKKTIDRFLGDDQVMSRSTASSSPARVVNIPTLSTSSLSSASEKTPLITVPPKTDPKMKESKPMFKPNEKSFSPTSESSRSASSSPTSAKKYFENDRKNDLAKIKSTKAEVSPSTTASKSPKMSLKNFLSKLKSKKANKPSSQLSSSESSNILKSPNTPKSPEIGIKKPTPGPTGQLPSASPSSSSSGRSLLAVDNKNARENVINNNKPVIDNKTSHIKLSAPKSLNTPKIYDSKTVRLNNLKKVEPLSVTSSTISKPMTSSITSVTSLTEVTPKIEVQKNIPTESVNVPKLPTADNKAKNNKNTEFNNNIGNNFDSSKSNNSTLSVTYDDSSTESIIKHTGNRLKVASNTTKTSANNNNILVSSFDNLKDDPSITTTSTLAGKTDSKISTSKLTGGKTIARPTLSSFSSETTSNLNSTVNIISDVTESSTSTGIKDTVTTITESAKNDDNNISNFTSSIQSSRWSRDSDDFDSPISESVKEREKNLSMQNLLTGSSNVLQPRESDSNTGKNGKEISSPNKQTDNSTTKKNVKTKLGAKVRTNKSNNNTNKDVQPTNEDANCKNSDVFMKKNLKLNSRKLKTNKSKNNNNVIIIKPETIQKLPDFVPPPKPILKDRIRQIADLTMPEDNSMLTSLDNQSNSNSGSITISIPTFRSKLSVKQESDENRYSQFSFEPMDTITKPSKGPINPPIYSNQDFLFDDEDREKDDDELGGLKNYLKYKKERMSNRDEGDYCANIREKNMFITKNFLNSRKLNLSKCFDTIGSSENFSRDALSKRSSKERFLFK
ncbi:hypothetical protein HELRODRAFT_182535 [Helobdella robusta]|uniref:Tetraspanin n=1 Tax=Helobdella robusta TaxID=6412 RepID=T1FIB8_HELRO|nr:hypothetical protein HELRODRAFT_182535 [Helobdella robusta]ESN90826.1 hypothetical protein HELRODRAFT_182535 [Helobdella robusta]